MPNKNVKIYDADSGEILCRVTQDELACLEDHLEDDFIEELEYELTALEAKSLAQSCEDPDLIDKIELMLKDRSRAYIYWASQK